MGDMSVVKVLGGQRLLGKRILNPLDLADVVEAGLPRQVADRLQQRLDWSDGELAQGLGVSGKTLQRIGKDAASRLTPAQSDRLFRLARIVGFAEEVFEDGERAHRWLKEPQRGLGNRSPLSLLSTEAGAREVEDLLGRIEFGVFS
jgi:putative toxin-antitoxin system antitoxin component (TIGR02293 family)